jgi:hypothetical protein
MIATRLLAEAKAAGVRLRVEGGVVRMTARHEPSAALLAKLREHKPAILALLTCKRCQYCGDSIAWRQPGGLTFADGTGAHLICYEQAEMERLLAAARHVLESPDALAGEAELTLHGGLLP